MRRGIFRALAPMLLLAACGGDRGVAPTEWWVADLVQTQQVLFMAFTIRSGSVSGTGSLSHLTNNVSEPLTVSGTRTPDSLSVAFAHGQDLRFTFGGSYGTSSLQGILHGSEFDSVAVLFRQQ